MADSKITALTALTAADPANDMIPIVDVSDTPPASGNTKRISINNILACSPSATLASATITGDLTVDTNVLKVDTSTNNVGINQTNPSAWLVNGLGIGSGSGDAGATIYTGTANTGYLCFADGTVTTDRYRGYIGYLHNGDALSFGANAIEQYRIAPLGVFSWYDGAGGTRMTLNSTGLGVGVSPAVGFELQQTSPMARITSTSTTGYSTLTLRNTGASGRTYGITVGGSGTGATAAGNLYISDDTASAIRLTLDSSGNVGVGVTPSAWDTYKAIQVGARSMFFGVGTEANVANNAYYASGGYKYVANSFAGLYSIDANVHKWFNAPLGTAGNAITFTQAMTLTASGDLLVGQTTAGLDASGGIWVRSASSAFGSSVIINHRTAVGTGNSYAEFTHNGVVIGSISQDGTTGVLYNITSDYRLKESVVPLSGGLARVNALKPSVYNWKSDGSAGEGFLAHELAEVVPFAVTGEKDAVNEDGTIKTQGIDMSRIVPILVAAIKELSAEVNALKNA
jgi:hypothetical protein